MSKGTDKKQTKKEEGVGFKSILPGLIIGTIIVVTIGIIGRRATSI